jgi:hypothetical protein
VGVSSESEVSIAEANVEARRASSEARATPGESQERVSSVETLCNVRVSGALLCACRAGLVECGQWDDLRADLAARMEIEPVALDEISASDWLELASLTALFDAQRAHLDLDWLKTRVRRHVSEAESGHLFAPMLRSWTRSFASAEHMLRALGPLFRAGLRNAEVPLVRAMGDSEAHVLVRGALLPPLRSSLALRAAFEGLLLGLLDLARPRPMLPEVEIAFGREELCAVCHF